MFTLISQDVPSTVIETKYNFQFSVVKFDVLLNNNLDNDKSKSMEVFWSQETFRRGFFFV